MDCYDRPATDAVLTNLRGCAADAAGVLGLAADATPAGRVAAVDAFVDRWQHGDRPAAGVVAADDVPYLLGSLWGAALVAALGWAWAEVTFNRHKETAALAVVSPDRSLAIFPVHFVLACLEDTGVDCTVALAFEQLTAGAVDGYTPGGYANVMDVVYREGPRG